MTLSRRARVWLIALATLALLLLAGVWLIGRLLQPERLTPLLLGRIGGELGLVLTVERPADYALRPEPRLVLFGLSAREPGGDTPLLRAERVQLALPWSTLTGGEPVITRVVMESPVLDLPALQAWIETRPPSDAPLRVPTFTDGIAVEDGRVLGDGWSVGAIALSLPTLAAGEPSALSLDGTIRSGDTAMPFAFELAATPRDTADGIAFDALAIRSDSPSPLPAFEASGELAYGGGFAFDLHGTLTHWPADWPPLPAPYAESEAPLRFSMAYRGAANLTAPITAEFARDELRAQSRFILSELLAWLDDGATPLPPLTGTANAPVLEIEGVRLEGIRIEADDETAPDAQRAASAPEGAQR